MDQKKLKNLALEQRIWLRVALNAAASYQRLLWKELSEIEAILGITFKNLDTCVSELAVLDGDLNAEEVDAFLEELESKIKEKYGEE